VGEPTGSGARAAALAADLTSVLGDVVAQPEVVDLVRLSGGASRETWAFDLLAPTGAAARPMVLQRERPGGVRSSGGMAAEADLIRAAGRQGVPVPEVLAAGDDDGLGGPWMVAERIDGETIPRRILREDALADARQLLAAQAGAAAAGIHRIPLDEVHGIGEQDQVRQLRGTLDQLGHPHPALELGFRWLEAHRPATSRPTAVVHGDLRLGNLIVGPEGLRAVLDWELAHLGDPIEDLGWLCVRSWRFGGELPVAGVGTREALCAAYSDASGSTVEPADLVWWEVLGTLKWGVICIMQASAHLLGLTRSVELAAIGRRVAETEHDLLELIAPGSMVRPADPGPSSSGRPHASPTAAELVEAVRELLQGDVMEATDGRVRFHTRVATNVLAMVERELRLGPSQAAAHQERLRALGVADDVELAAAIRAGTLAVADDEVVRLVAASVADELAVSNPEWFGVTGG
jgi:aminoglycoside phosphotransferase (APT) family kinase protein